MGRFFGTIGKHVVWVGQGRGIPVPAELESVSTKEIITEYEVSQGKLMRKDRTYNPTECRAAFIGVFGIACGIATYSEALWNEMGPLFKEAHIFAEEGQGLNDSDRITHCWKRNESPAKLLAMIEQYDPDVVFIQHEYGVFPNARHWLALINALAGRKVIVTLHSVYEHRDKTVIEASCAKIVVHTELAKQCLEAKGITNAPIHVIPHGADQPSAEQLWNIYQSKHTLLQFGFGFRYKGWETSLRVVAELKKEFPDVFFTGLVSRSPFSGTEAELYLRELRALVKQLAIEENVCLLSGFQSEEVLDAFFRTNRVGIFPYKDNGVHTVYACSGAARRAMSAGLPIVTSTVPLFSDLAGVVTQKTTVEDLSAEVRRLFEPKNRLEQVLKQEKFLTENSWANVARQYADLVR